MSRESTGTAALWGEVEKLGWEEIGRSHEGRAIRAGCVRPGPAPLVLMAGIHGNEASSVAATLDLLAWLSDGGESAGPLWVVPLLNPDGLLRNSKDSAAGVDLNRNFPAANFSAAHRPGYFPGTGPASEPETRAFVDFIERLEPWGVVAVHAPFSCINFDGPARAWAEWVAHASGWPVQADIGYPTPGSLGSWLGAERGLPVLTVELPAGDYGTFVAPAREALRAALGWRNR